MLGRLRERYKLINEQVYLKKVNIKNKIVVNTRIPSSPSSLTSAQSYPKAKSTLPSLVLAPRSGGAFPNIAEASVLFPVPGFPNKRTFLEGMEREEDTLSRIEDQRS